MAMRLPIKCVIVGDPDVGKTELLLTYTSGYPSHYVPMVFDNYSKNVDVDEQSVSLTLWDTAGQECYQGLRPLSYPRTDVFILAFSITNPMSFQNIKDKWVPEVRHHCPRAPILLIGTHVNQRSNTSASISTSQGKDLAKYIGAVNYIECSAFTGEGVKTVFHEAVQAVLERSKINDQLAYVCDVITNIFAKRKTSS